MVKPRARVRDDRVLSSSIASQIQCPVLRLIYRLVADSSALRKIVTPPLKILEYPIDQVNLISSRQ